MSAPTKDVAFVVGALTFLGRVDDAQSCFDGWRMRASARDVRTSSAARFFLGVAYARTGDFARAHDLLVTGARGRAREEDQWAAALVFQGLACQRYFTGKYRAAARHALRALRAAQLAGFAYARMLSTDLRGHALVQLGQYQAGMALLKQAPRGEWVTVTANGYGLAVSAQVCGAPGLPEPLEVPLLEDDALEEPALPAAKAGAARDTAEVDLRVLDGLRSAGEVSMPDLARQLGMSESTALRALRRLIKGKRAARRGAARATRYRVLV